MPRINTMRWFLPMIMAGVMVTASGRRSMSAEPAAEKEKFPAVTTEKGTRLLLGFEMDEYKKIADPWIRNEKPKWRVKAGYPYYLGSPSEAESSQGKHSRSKFMKYEINLKPSTSEEPRRSVSLRSATILRTCGWHHLCFGRDWSEYAELWVDVKTTSPAVIAIEVEDEASPIPLARTFQVPEGKWTTLKFDLAAAQKMRLLDLDKIVSIYFLCEKIAKGSRIYIDNIRLASPGAQARLTVIKDASPWQTPAEPPSKDGKTTRPEKVKPLELKSDRVPIPDHEKPVTIQGKSPAWGNALHKVPRGIGAFDNKHLSSIFMAPTGSMRVSADGGAVWRGFAGKAYTVAASGNNTPNRHGFFCGPNEALCAYITHCAGGGSPSNIWFRRVVFDGTKWTAEKARVIDPDVRHCPEWFEVIRLPNGRLWAAWDHYQRLKGITILARFSDDHGKTWQHGGKLGNVSPPLNLGSTPRLIAFGANEAGIAYSWRAGHKAYFTRFDQKAFDGMYEDYRKQKPEEKRPWDRFAQKSAWTEPQLLPKGQEVHSALGMPDGRVVAAVTKPAAVLVWDGSTWKESLSDSTGLLTRCGENVVLVCKDKTDRKIVFRVFRKGKWSALRTAVDEVGGVKSFAVPRVSPPNYVPLAWSIAADKNAIRALRLGIKEKR